MGYRSHRSRGASGRTAVPWRLARCTELHGCQSKNLIPDIEPSRSIFAFCSWLNRSAGIGSVGCGGTRKFDTSIPASGGLKAKTLAKNPILGFKRIGFIEKRKSAHPPWKRAITPGNDQNRGKLWGGAMPGSTLAKAGPLQKTTRLDLAMVKKKNKNRATHK